MTENCIELEISAYTKSKNRLEIGCMLHVFQTEKTNDKHYTLLINDLHQTARDLQDAYNNLGNATDPDLIDCYIYELNYVQIRYKFLLRSIKNYEKNRGLLY